MTDDGEKLARWLRDNEAQLTDWQAEIAKRIAAGERIAVSWPRGYGKRRFYGLVVELERLLSDERGEAEQL